jgi:uncharacterized protein
LNYILNTPQNTNKNRKSSDCFKMLFRLYVVLLRNFFMCFSSSINSFLSPDPADFCAAFQPILTFPRVIVEEIFDCFELEELLNFKKKMPKSLAEYSFRVLAREYGCPSREREEKFLTALFKVVRTMHQRNFLSGEGVFTFEQGPFVQKMDCENTLLKISKLPVKKIIHLYHKDEFYNIRSLSSFHSFFLKCLQLPLQLDEEDLLDVFLNRAFVRAVCAADIQAAQLLRLVGADPNIPIVAQEVPLFFALRSKRPKIVKELLLLGADPNMLNEHGTSPLILCLKSPLMTKSLLEARADPNYREPKRQFTALFLSLVYRQMENVRTYLQYEVDLNLQFTDSRLTILGILSRGDLEQVDMVRSCLEKNADPNLREGDESTPIFGAIAKGYQKTVTCLVDAGADLHAMNAWGESPLTIAVSKKKRNIAKDLLKKKADPDVGRQAGLSPLHLAVASKDQEIVSMLLRCGAHQHALDHEGRTPLECAVEHGSKKIIKMLSGEFS